MPGDDSARGFGFALAACAIWGILPLYFKLLVHVPTAEVIAHRVIWAVPIALTVLLLQGRTSDLRQAIRTPTMVGMALVTASLLSVNWGTYVWLIQTDQAMDAALGYYINPIFSVLLGATLLGEKLSPRQWAAVALAVMAVAVLTIDAGTLPVGALLLVFSWGGYAYFKRALPIGPNQGFALEALLMLPFACIFLVWGWQQELLFTPRADGPDWALLLGSGVITAAPLMLYAHGAKGLRLSTIAILGYSIPTLIFLMSVFIFREPFTGGRVIAFPMIWAAMALYILEILRMRRRKRI